MTYQIHQSQDGSTLIGSPDASATVDPGTVSEAALLNAIITQRLTAEGKTLVDDAQIARLTETISWVTSSWNERHAGVQRAASDFKQNQRES